MSSLTPSVIRILIYALIGNGVICTGCHPTSRFNSDLSFQVHLTALEDPPWLPDVFSPHWSTMLCQLLAYFKNTYWQCPFSSVSWYSPVMGSTISHSDRPEGLGMVISRPRYRVHIAITLSYTLLSTTSYILCFGEHCYMLPYHVYTRSYEYLGKFAAF